MGRKPIRDKPLTPAERQKRRRDKLKKWGYTRKETWTLKNNPAKAGKVTPLDVVRDDLFDYLQALGSKGDADLFAVYYKMLNDAKEKSENITVSSLVYDQYKKRAAWLNKNNGLS
jgi:hypothetical protein